MPQPQDPGGITSVSPGGRRPGNLDTRQDIIQAATRIFAANGYDKASLRAVAREAGVDAALVHHYFDGKAALFMAAMSLPFDPRQVQEASGSGPAGSFGGARIVEGFLCMWDRAEGSSSAFALCMSAIAASPDAADAMREFVGERVWRRGPTLEGEDDATVQRRRALVASQLMGLAFTRYVLRVPPISTASPEDIGRWVGPTLERYVVGEVG